jgi:hypothetical protein
VDDDGALGRLGALPGVAEAIAEARTACARLRWHPALRRRSAQARAEVTARAARASAALEGADLPLDVVRELLMGTRTVPQDGVGLVAAGAVRATGLANTCGRVLREAPAQALARLHLASAAGLAAEPALLVAALAHGQVLAVRPFDIGSAVVARAVFRAVTIDRGLDPTGVCAPEVAWAATGSGRYAEALAGYRGGTPDGVAGWLRYCADAVTQGAQEGERVCAAVRAGRLTR